MGMPQRAPSIWHRYGLHKTSATHAGNMQQQTMKTSSLMHFWAKSEEVAALFQGRDIDKFPSSFTTNEVGHSWRVSNGS